MYETTEGSLQHAKDTATVVSLVLMKSLVSGKHTFWWRRHSYYKEPILHHDTHKIICTFIYYHFANVMEFLKCRQSNPNISIMLSEFLLLCPQPHEQQLLVNSRALFCKKIRVNRVSFFNNHWPTVNSIVSSCLVYLRSMNVWAKFAFRLVDYGKWQMTQDERRFSWD